MQNGVTARVKRRLVWAILFATACGYSSARAEERLADVVTYAVQNHPQVRVAVAQRDEAQAAIDEARAAYLPLVTLNANGGARRQDTAFGKGQALKERSATLSLTQTLFDGGGRKAELARQRAREVSMGERERETRERIAMEAIEAYANVLTAQKMQELAKENLESHRSVVAKLRELVRIDPGRRSELSQALARQSLAEVVLTARAVRVRESAIQYERVVGRAPGALDELNMPALESGREDALQVALRANPAIAIAEAEIRAAENAELASRAQGRPRVQLEMTGRRSQDFQGAIGRSADTALMLSASWNLFDGGAAHARTRQASAQLVATRATADDTRRTVRENFEVAWNTLKGHAQSNRDLDDQVRLASETLEAYRSQFRIGRRSVLDVLNAENELFTARSNLVSGHYSERIAAFQVLSVEGRLFEAVARNKDEAQRE
jgi:adhesin transport system outer membrane protein